MIWEFNNPKKFCVSFQVLSNLNEEEVLAEIRKYVFIFIGIGVFSGITNFVMVSSTHYQFNVFISLILIFKVYVGNYL